MYAKLICKFDFSFAGHYAESIKLPVSLYCASKYAITGMIESLRNELAAVKANIKVTVSIKEIINKCFLLSILLLKADIH